MNLLSTNDDDILLAAEAITAGRLVAFPTETVYGLGADAFNPDALARIFEAKGRPRFDPLIVHIAGLDALPRIANLDALSPEARRQFEILSAQLWPGPLTLILPKRPEVPDLATSGLPSVAIRFPSHPVAQNLIARSTGAVAAPSANPFGYLSPTCAEHVREQLGDKVDFIIDGGPCSVGVESTVLDLSGGPARILRPGGASRERIEALLGPVLVGGGAEGGTAGVAATDRKRVSGSPTDSSAAAHGFADDRTPAPSSPGQLKSHYAPRTPLSLHTRTEMAALRYNPADGYLFFDGASRDAWRGLEESKSDTAQRPNPPSSRIQTLSETGSITEAAANLFSVLHYMDTLGLSRLHAERAPGQSLGPAINDRLSRAASDIDTITPYSAPDSPMKPWPALAPLGRLLHIRGSKETIFYYDTGTNTTQEKPAIVLIHGLGDEADSWRHLIPLLQREYRVLALDLPGFGRSAAPGRITIKRHIAAVIVLLEASGCASPAVLVGSSLGAGIAEGAAIARPDLVQGLILLDGCFPSSIRLDSGFVFLALPFLGKAWYRKFRKDHEAAYQSLFGYYADIEDMSGEDRQFLRERVIARVESDTQERAYFGSLRSLVWTRLSAARYFSRGIAAYTQQKPGKLLILWGEQDRVLPPDSAKAVQALCPGTELTVIPGAGHLPHQERAGETASAILRFMTELEHR